jgi:hypothetical protein
MLVGVVSSSQAPEVPGFSLLVVYGAPDVELVVDGVDDLVNAAHGSSQWLKP